VLIRTSRIPSLVHRIAGLLCLTSGLALVAIPRRTADLFGLPADPELCRALGWRDVLIGLGLLQRRWIRMWWFARTLSDAFDVRLMFRNGRHVANDCTRHRAKIVFGCALVGVDAFVTRNA
jgi:hypothetical protein